MTLDTEKLMWASYHIYETNNFCTVVSIQAIVHKMLTIFHIFSCLPKDDISRLFRIHWLSHQQEVASFLWMLSLKLILTASSFRGQPCPKKAKLSKLSWKRADFTAAYWKTGQICVNAGGKSLQFSPLTAPEQHLMQPQKTTYCYTRPCNLLTLHCIWTTLK